MEGKRKSHIEIQTDDYPCMIQIIKSGWSNYYHVIIEEPEEGDLYHTHEFISESEIKLRFHIDPRTGEELYRRKEL